MEQETNNEMPESGIEPEVAPEAVDVQQPASKPAYAQFILPGAILLAALIVSGTLLYTRGGNGAAQIGGSGANQPAEKVDIKINSDDHVLGNKNAKITIVEFSDFQCPFCRSFWSGAFPEIKKNYIDTGKARFVYKHYPLDFHSGARPAAEASECANDQGKFWEFHDRVFEEQTKLGQGTIQFGNPEIVKWAGALGLNMDQFNECFNSGKYAQRVSDDMAQGTKAGVGGTPTSYVNGQKIVGAQPYTIFQAIIEGLLKK
ncbi:MAG: DsbA family protein [Candidatus Yanofskybacteria bacterium]|nr:DsbA family protein [Candidatus Yanofskybacteria bacterium]